MLLYKILIQTNKEIWDNGVNFRLMEQEEKMYWAERRRFEEEGDDINWYRRFPNRGPNARLYQLKYTVKLLYYLCLFMLSIWVF